MAEVKIEFDIPPSTYPTPDAAFETWAYHELGANEESYDALVDPEAYSYRASWDNGRLYENGRCRDMILREIKRIDAEMARLSSTIDGITTAEALAIGDLMVVKKSLVGLSSSMSWRPDDG